MRQVACSTWMCALWAPSSVTAACILQPELFRAACVPLRHGSIKMTVKLACLLWLHNLQAHRLL